MATKTMHTMVVDGQDYKIVDQDAQDSISNLHKVATTGSYDDLEDTPGAFTAPTSGSAGESGFVPAPPASDFTVALLSNAAKWKTLDFNGSGSNGLVQQTSTTGSKITYTFRDASASMGGLMSATDKTKLDGIGTVMTARLASDMSVSPSTGTAICSISLPKGVWQLIGYVRFPSNASGVRRACIDTTSGANYLHVQQTATNGGMTQMQVNSIIEVTAATETWYLNVWHNSTSSLTMPAGTSTGYTNGIRAVRIA